MLNAAYLTTGFVVLAVGARYLLAGRHIEEGRTMLRMAIGLTAVLAPLQLIIGDQHGLNTLKYQPVKVAAMEAHWDGSKPGDFADLRLARREDADQPLRDFDPARLVVDPHARSERPVSRLDQRAAERAAAGAGRVLRLPHHAGGSGSFMIAAALYGAFLWWRGTLFETRWYLRIVAQTWWVGFIAVMAGWITTETGRQPWIVEKILRTADATSPVIGESIAVTLVLFVLAYGVVFSFGIYYINRLINRGPEKVAEETGGFAGSPISAAHDAGRAATQGG